MRRWAALAGFGAFLCTVLDHLHATHDVLSYAHPVAWNQAWWVPLLFAGATLVIVASASPMRALLGGLTEAPPTARQIAGDAIGFITAYSFTAFGHTQPVVVLVVLTAFWTARTLHCRAPWMVLYSIGVATGGTLFEAALSSTGTFHYHHPDLLGVPCWLPAIYLHAALFAGPMQLFVRRASLATSHPR